MRKIFYLIFMLSAIAPCIFGQSGVIRELTGSVELKSAGASSFAAAQIGGTVEKNTVISTGFKSIAVIAVGSSLITVRPLTRLSLTEIMDVSNSEKININLQTGRIKVDVKPPAGTRTRFTVQSPSAVASVRGTSFEFDTVNLSVSEGKVVFSGISGAAAILYSGESSYAGTDGTIANPSDVSAASLLPPAQSGAEPAQRPAAGQVTIIPVY